MDKRVLRECFTILTSFIENSLRKSISKKKVFIRNDKSNLTIHQKWVSSKTKRLYNKIKQDMNPNDLKYEDIQQQFIRNLNLDRDENKSKYFLELTNEREKWNFINEARNSLRTNCHPIFKKCFWRLCYRSKESSKPPQLQIFKTGRFYWAMQIFQRRNV